MEKKKILLIKLVFTILFVFTSSNVLIAQTGTIKGTVTDNSGNVLPGANVVIEGTNIGEMTNLDGYFLIKEAPVGEQKINISFVGYEAQSKTITIFEDKSIELAFTLKEDIYSLKEITVTASRRSENIQEVAQSISAISGKGLEEMGATEMEGYLKSLPGINLLSASPAQNDISIRGVAPLGGWSATVGYYIGETPLTELDLQPSFGSFDVERIEVLRGPQGTLYGEGSMGGTVKVIPNNPNVDSFQFKFDPEFSSTDKGGSNYQVNAMANIPIIKDKFAARATGFYQNNEGYINNIGIDVENVNNSEIYNGRLMLRYLATDKLYFTGSAIFNKMAIGGQYTGNENFEQITSVRENLNDNFSIYNLNAYYDFSFANLTVTGSYYNRESDRVIDLGYLVPVLDGMFGPIGLGPFTGVWTDDVRDYGVFTAESRLVSTSDGPLNWTVGVFYKNYNMKGEINGDSDPIIPDEVIGGIGASIGIPDLTGTFISNNSRDVKQLALFTEVNYDITEHFNVLGGLRLFNEKRDFSNYTGGLFNVFQTGLPPAEYTDKSDETVLNPKFTFTYNSNKGLVTYVTASKGFRSGGQNLFAAMFQGAPTSYGAETLWNYEGGLKSVISKGKLIANAAIFYNKWTDMQLRTRSFASLTVTENVGEAHTSGIDAEIIWMPIKGLSLSANGNYTKAETDTEVLLPSGNDPNTGEELFEEVPAGTQLPQVPEFSMNLAAQYKLPIKNAFLISRAEYNHTGESTSALLNAKENPSYSTLNLRVGYEYKWIEAYVFANNVSNNVIRQSYWFDDPVTGTNYVLGRPRTIGIGFRTNF